jgi:hypothetical protein
MFKKSTRKKKINKQENLRFVFIFKREQFAAVAAIANHHRFPPPPPSSSSTTVDDPDVNVVDLDDGNEEEEEEEAKSTSPSCQESFNSDQRYSVQELDPPKCVACM